ncbi:MAG: class II aldolase/adducin family protein [Planctomycetota bacterium]|nr:class II aldolase/adducin family protein [Planctomycetota bacterium]
MGTETPSRWNDAEARKLDEAALHDYVTGLFGPGVTSVKRVVIDALGRRSNVIRMRSPAGAVTHLRLDDLEPLADYRVLADAEAMDFVRGAMVDPREPVAPIEALLHAFVPDRWIVHGATEGLLALCSLPDGAARLLALFGSQIVLVGHRRPGHKLAQDVAAARRANPSAQAIIVLRAGFIAFGADAREVYETHAELERRCLEALPLTRLPEPRESDRSAAAVLAPPLRPAGHVLLWDDSPATRAFVADETLLAAAQKGPAAPADVAVTKRVPCVVRTLEDLSLYRADYEAYASSWDRHGLPAEDPSPRVLLVPGLGMWTAGRTYEDALAARETYRRTMRIIRRCGAAWLPAGPEECFQHEYWPLRHRAKAEREDPRELAGRVAWIGHAAGARGRAAASVLAEAGVHVMLVDDDVDGLREVGGAIGARAAAVRCDLTNADQIAESFSRTALAFGGVDIVVCRGEAAVIEAAASLFRAQGFFGSVVVDGPVPENVPQDVRVNAVVTDGAWDAALLFLASDRGAAIRGATL